MKNKKWKVLIADDEVRIGLLIQKLIQWDELACVLVGIVQNGEEAYQMINNEAPDIVITDIRMPKMNGLELISKTKEINKHVQFIVISGYKEFEYAHRALSYGVSHYLLKPIKEEELNKVIKETVEELKRRQVDDLSKEKLKETVSISEQIIKSNFLNRIINQEETPIADDIQDEYHLDLEGELYLGVVVKLDNRNFEATDSKQDSLTKSKVLSIINEKLEGQVKEKLICEREQGYIFCLLAYEADKFKEIKTLINLVLSEVQDYLIGFEQYEVTIGIGLERKEFEEIRFSIQEAQKAVQNRIELGTGRLIYSKHLPSQDTNSICSYLESLEARLLTSINSYSKETLEHSIQDIFRDLQKEEKHSSFCYYELGNQLIQCFFEKIEIQDNQGQQLKEFLLSSIQHCYSVSGLKSLLIKHLGAYLEHCLKVLETEPTKPIRKAKEYIDQHYSEKIVLEDIAERVGLNPVYFSTLFKNEMDINFSAYLINVRMEAAKHILRNSNETIAAVAAQVGYKDVRYFSQLFAKTIGVKPALYRKLHS